MVEKLRTALHKKVDVLSLEQLKDNLELTDEIYRMELEYMPKCREVCTDEEYQQLNTAFFEKEKNLSKI